MVHQTCLVGPLAMSVKFMIIDGSAEFRSLLMHHVTTHWPDAIISAYDPVAAGQLPEEFSGAGNDMILLGSAQGDVDPLKTLAQFIAAPGFPPVVYFAGNVKERTRAGECGSSGSFLRSKVPHKALIILLSDILRAQQRTASTDSLFVGDIGSGIQPLIKGYRVIKKLGVSEHSAVYLAEKESVGIKIALKVLRQNTESADGIGAFDRFLQEYELIAELDHPNIVKIHDLGVGDDHAHIAMEYLGGGDLKQRIAQRIEMPDAVRYLKEIAAALTRIHSVGILHRDLKPANIMFRQDTSIALIDFGLAKRMRLKQEITDSGQIFGTPYYMSPEQGHGDDVDERSDIYSLGIVFYEMLTGAKPYVASNAMAIIIKHNKAPLPVLPQAVAQHQALLNLLLAKKPEDRLQSVQEVLEWL